MSGNQRWANVEQRLGRLAGLLGRRTVEARLGIAGGSLLSLLIAAAPAADGQAPRGVRPDGFNPSGVGDMGGPTPPRAIPQGLPIGDLAPLGAAPGELPTNLDVADPVVADVQVVGNRIIPASRILSKIKTHPGRPYQPLVVKNDVRTLYATNWFYDVSTETQGPPENPVVVYRVVERPVIQKVEYRGNTVFREKDLREATGLQAGKAMDPGMNSIRSAEIERKYREK
ncbi:MAG: POTRA domain-containing protein, partial [Planctomycetia bacterium]